MPRPAIVPQRPRPGGGCSGALPKPRDARYPPTRGRQGRRPRLPFTKRSRRSGAPSRARNRYAAEPCAGSLASDILSRSRGTRTHSPVHNSYPTAVGIAPPADSSVRRGLPPFYCRCRILQRGGQHPTADDLRPRLGTRPRPDSPRRTPKITSAKGDVLRELHQLTAP